MVLELTHVTETHDKG